MEYGKATRKEWQAMCRAYDLPVEQATTPAVQEKVRRLLRAAIAEGKFTGKRREFLIQHYSLAPPGRRSGK